MFDIGFSELFVIAVVALIVIGPERLPKVARTMGHLMGRLQRYVNDVKADINREMELDELRKFKQEFETTAQGVENSIRSEFANTQNALNAAANEAVQGPSKSSASQAPPAEAATAALTESTPQAGAAHVEPAPSIAGTVDAKAAPAPLSQPATSPTAPHSTA